ncbi:hypothetical protein N1F78_07220 [Seonamhaeicola sp. MEBiC1930]|uniref:lectin-like domain-containing protein n=1 Tax=Seonamhaeicola sp. MEBiC01930 TaxID=2976768 RepID=UPI0032478C47
MKNIISQCKYIVLVYCISISFNSFAQTQIDSEDFESGSFSGTIWNDPGSDCRITSENEISGSYSPYVRDNSSTSYMYTDDIDLTSYTSVTIEFDYATRNFDSGEDFFLEFSDDGGSTWDSTPILNYVYSTDFSNDTTYTDETITIESSTYSFTSNSRFRFRGDANDDNEHVYLDNIVITGNTSSGGGGGSGGSSSTCSTYDTEDFESGSYSGTIWNDPGSDCKINSSSKLSGTYSMNLEDNTSSSYSYTDDIDLSSYDSVTITFDFDTDSDVNSGDDLYIEFSDDGGSTWHSTAVLHYQEGTDFNDDTTYTDVTATATNGSPYNFTSNSRFRFRVDIDDSDGDLYIDNIEINVCSGSGGSGGSGGSSSTCSTTDSEDFDSSSFSGSIWNDGGSNCGFDSSWVISGSDNVYLRDNESSSVMYTDDIDLSSYDSVTIEFDFRTWSYDSGEDFFIEFSDDGGSSWDNTPVLQYVRGTDFSDNSTIYTDIVATAESSTYNFTANSRFRFRGDASSSSEYVYFDNIEINVCSSSGGSSGGTDTDGDGIADTDDLDDDNDGILDTVEGYVDSFVAVSISQLPNHIENDDLDKLFDGSTSYTGDQDLRIHSFDVTPGDLNGSILDNALVMGTTGANVIPTGAYFTLTMENDDVGGEDASDIAADLVSELTDLGLDPNDLFQGAFNDVGTIGLDGSDFDRDGDGDIDTAGVDFSPMGVILQFFNGDPSSGGTLISTSFSQIELYQPSGTQQHIVTVTSPTTHFVISSLPDGTGKDIRLNEIQINGSTNTGSSGGSLGFTTDLSTDTDDDGTPDYLDLDSDGDGCYDSVESGGTDADNDGVLDGTGYDSNGQVTGGTGGYNGLDGDEIVGTQLTVSSTPSNTTVSTGNAISFSVSASARNTTIFSSGTPDYTEANSSSSDSGINYQWYLGDPTSGGTALTNSGVYSNVETNQLDISDVTGLDGNEYYIVITHDDIVCIEQSNSATLTVTAADPCDPVASGNTDTDGDGVSDVCDVDDDNDGLLDCTEKGITYGTISEVFELSGTATETSSTEFRLTENTTSQAGAATIIERINFNNSFSFSFDAYLGDSNSGADGIAIIFHDDPSGSSAVGAVGEGLGAQGIQNGIVLELDTYDNGSTRGDLSNDHGMIWDSDNQSGAGLLTTATDLGDLEDDTWHTVTINWDASTNTINYYVDSTLAGTYTDDLINNYFGGNNLVYFGFSASTGAAYNNQSVRFNSVCDIPLFVDTDNDGLADSVDLDSDNDGIPDNIEGQTTLGYILPSGTVNNSGSYIGLWDNYGTGITPEDTDSDDIEDYMDTNSDNDDYDDIEENGMANAVTSTDDDNDGLDNVFETTGTNDGTWDVNEDIHDPSDLSILPDTDSDVNSGGDVDYRDVAPTVVYPSSAAIDFDGVDDYLNGNSIIDGLSNVTIMAWIKIDAENDSASKNTIAGEDIACRLFVEDGNEIEFSIRTTAGTLNTLSAGEINYGEWHHVAGVFSSTTGKQTIYLDGEVIETDTNSGNIGQTIDPSSDWTGDFEIGRISSSIVDRQYFDGEIDEVRIFNVALTDSQIQTMIYQEIEDNSGNVKGSIIPKDIIDFDTEATISWSSLVAYYPMTDIASNQVSDYSSNSNTLTMHNITTVQEQTAPLPYKTTSDGTWDLEGAWQYGNVWDIEGVPSTREWCIVKIENDVTISNSISTYGLIIDSGKTLTVSGNNLLKNTGYFELNGSLDLMNDSQLIQTQTSDLVTSANGKALRRQEGTSSAYWYNYWSSPTGATGATSLIDNNGSSNNTNNSAFTLDMLKDGDGFNCEFTSAYTASGNISSYWIFAYKNGKTYWDWSKVTTTSDIEPGVGYTQKGTGVPFSEQQYIFEGKPNNGTILVSATDVGGPGSVQGVSKTTYLLGNPYPSALDIHTFIDDNASVIGGTLQLWHQWSGSSHNLNEYNGGYAQVNKLGSTRAYQFVGIDGANNGSQDGTLVPSRYLPIGQGFIAEIIADGNVEFNNGQRVFILEEDADGTYSSGSVFFKGSKSKGEESTAKSTSDSNPFKKIRLEFSSVSGPDTRRELLLGFSDMTTDDYDYGYDSRCDEENNNDLNLNLEGVNMNIQAYGEITSDKSVPLNFKSSGSNTFEIKISELENIGEDQEIYIKDNLTGTYYDLRQGSAYGFSSEQGKFNERFEIVFQSEQQSLSVAEASHDANFIYYVNKQRRIHVKKLSSSVTRMSLISMTGQTVMELQDVPTNVLEEGIEIPNVSTGAYVACFRTDDNQVLTKKIVVN